jgi:hypothetical protein
MLVAVVGLVLVQRLVPPDRREEQNDVAGFIYAVLGVAYAVLLAFVVIAVWQDYNTAQTNVESEAHELAGVYFLASQLPEPQRTHVQDLARTYARVVVEEEWPMMEQGQTSPRADSLLRQLRLKLLEFDPRTKGEQVLYERGLTQVHDAVDARRSRLLEVREGIPNLLWVVLVVGGVISRCPDATHLRDTLHHRRVQQPVLRGRRDPAGRLQRDAGQLRRDLNKTCSYARSWL